MKQAPDESGKYAPGVFLRSFEKYGFFVYSVMKAE
jgi:hypothetical protein